MPAKKERKNKINLATAILSFMQQTQIAKPELIEAINDTFRRTYLHQISSVLKGKSIELKNSESLQTKIKFNKQNTKISFFVSKLVVRKVENPYLEIDFKDAIILDPKINLNEYLDVQLYVEDFSVTTITQFRQILKQKLYDLNVTRIYNDFISLKGQVVPGVVEKVEEFYAFVNVNDYSCFLPKKAQFNNEELAIGKRFVFYVEEVLEKSKGSQVVLSRNDDNLLFSLFRAEVPEYEKKMVSIVNRTRVPGVSSILVVKSENANVDPVGAFLGASSHRVKAVSSLINDEKIEIVKYDDDLLQFVVNLMNPVQIYGYSFKKNPLYEEFEHQEKTKAAERADLAHDENYEIIDNEFAVLIKNKKTRERKHIYKKQIVLVVAQEDLPIALGRKGQNAKSCSILTKCNIKFYTIDIADNEHVGYTKISSSKYYPKINAQKNNLKTGQIEEEDNNSLVD